LCDVRTIFTEVALFRWHAEYALRKSEVDGDAVGDSKLLPARGFLLVFLCFTSAAINESLSKRLWSWTRFARKARGSL
jgi:hypothetical protein